MKTLLQLDIIPIVIDKKPDPKYILLFMLLINVVIGFILITLTSRITLQYVNRIINQMNRLASGDFKARLTYGKPMSKHPTVVEVTNSFNKMAEELENTELLRDDFINNFKKNGYRSLHLIVSIPIFLAHEKRDMKVEIQLRTIAMDFWLAWNIRYVTKRM